MTVLIVGAGTIASEYIKVLLAQNITPLVVGRGSEKIAQLKKKYPEVSIIGGGLKEYLKHNKCPLHAIVATAVIDLAFTTKLLIQSECLYILAEKPLVYTIEEAVMLESIATQHNTNLFIAFNRRYYQSVLKAKELIVLDGGVTSFHFNFTEALFTIEPLGLDESQIKYLGIGNSCHPIDTAFQLGGLPASMESKQYGTDISWHQTGSIFTGLGETVSGVPFTYHANWRSPGRWNIEIMTRNRKLLFSPMEKLCQQNLNTFSIEDVSIDYFYDTNFKPGYYLQVQSFLKHKDLCGITEFREELKHFNKIFNY